MDRVVLLLVFISFSVQLSFSQDLAEKYHIKGVEFQEKGVYSRAMDYYNVALEKNPMLLKARYNRAVVFFELKNYTQSLLDIQQLMEAEPNDPELYSLMGLIQAKLNNPHEALHFIDQAINLLDAPIFHLRKADILIQNHHPELAFNELAAVIDQPALEVSGLELKAIAYLELNQPNQALRIYSDLIRLQPRAAFYFNRGILYKKIGDHVSACIDFQEAAKESFFLEALQELIQCQWKLKDIHNVQNTAKNGRAHFPNESIFYKFAGLAALKEGSHQVAIQWFEKAKELGANELDIYINLGIALLPTNKSKAKESFLLALKIDPTNKVAKHNLKVLNDQ